MTSSNQNNDRPRVWLIRHGESAHNDIFRKYKAKYPDLTEGNRTIAVPNYPHPDPSKPITLFDTNIVDAPLTDKGQGQARELQQKIKEQGLEFDLIISSPLDRALNTGILALDIDHDTKHQHTPIIVHPMIAERASFFCDLGHPKSQLQEKFKKYSQIQWNQITSEKWWPGADSFNKSIEPTMQKILNKEPIEGSVDIPVNDHEKMTLFPHTIQVESSAQVTARLTKFEDFLRSRKEKRIVVFAHNEVLRRISNRALNNCEMIEFDWNFHYNDEYFKEDNISKSIRHGHYTT